MNYIIRPFVENDLDTIIDLCSQHADYEKADYNKEGKKSKLKNALFSENKMLTCIVAESEGNLVGYATYTFDFSTWDAEKFIYLDALYLEENYRGFGIGEALMNKVKDTGVLNNCVNMQWQTPDFNVRAIKFYKRMGATGKNKVRFSLDLR
ncbi:GNAT family N-acetyltransferase [Chryseobacterium shigense]|uniref:Acetyltransferase (GNAT) family protein n=1 Tax=Chryseobacterium shigense TaxID=297244 RepID=A0A1N7HUM3_9FLAO|nr:GNAT family N-acetyltransferase [Chryseobacterium shigense]PQA93193.1 GNAT family N-acetyltransferase [Chryseobacterium shigense]SIS28522.1 Acetyltransferase (GNAT) family protein [Chryseobacterium shigense]